MFEIKIPVAERDLKSLSAAIGLALYNWAKGNEASAPITVTLSSTETVGDVSIVEQTKVVTTADIAKTIQSEQAQGNIDNVVKLNSAAGASDSTLSSVGQTQTHEQTNATTNLDAEGANVATGARQPSGNDLGNVDEKGVGKNTAFCGNAAIPFNATGPTKGQWKKRQGVDKEVYAAWYAESLAAVGDLGGEPNAEINTDHAFGADGGQGQKPEIDTTNAFAQQQTTQQNGQVELNGQSQQKEIAGGLTFDDAGAYMKWQAEQQAAGNITAGDIDSGFAQTQTGIQDLFNPQTAANAVALMYAFLAPIAAGQ
jgi:hypothetical protein